MLALCESEGWRHGTNVPEHFLLREPSTSPAQPRPGLLLLAYIYWWNRAAQKHMHTMYALSNVCTQQRMHTATYAHRTYSHSDVCTQQMYAHGNACTKQMNAHSDVCTQQMYAHRNACTQQTYAHRDVCTQRTHTVMYEHSDICKANKAGQNRRQKLHPDLSGSAQEAGHKC